MAAREHPVAEDKPLPALGRGIEPLEPGTGGPERCIGMGGLEGGVVGGVLELTRKVVAGGLLLRVDKRRDSTQESGLGILVGTPGVKYRPCNRSAPLWSREQRRWQATPQRRLARGHQEVQQPSC